MATQNKWLRTISANDVEAVKHYQELARINYVIMEEHPERYMIDIFLTEPTATSVNREKE